MKVLVVGANGQIGKHLIQLLNVSEHHSAVAMVRNEEQVASFKNLGVETTLANLESSVDDIAKAATGCQAIVFAAGSGGHTGADKTLLVDLDGAVKTIEAAEKLGIKRFIMVSALQAHQREHWSDAIKPYYVAKHYADRMLELSTLTYTIIRPGRLTNDLGTGHIKIGENILSGEIPREDVANTIFHSLEDDRTFYQAFDLVSGSVPIQDAFKILS